MVAQGIHILPQQEEDRVLSSYFHKNHKLADFPELLLPIRL